MSNKNKNFRSQHIIVALFLALLGVVLFILSEFIPNKIFNNVVSEIAGAVLISGILGIIDAYLLKESLIELILEKIKVKEEVNRTGLEELLPGITEINYKYYFKNANKNIDIVHIYGRTWTNNNIDEITERLLRTNCKIRVVLVDPSSPFVTALEEHFGYEKGQLVNLINSVSKMWKEKYIKKQSQGKRKTQSSIKLFYHRGQPTNSMYRIDNRVIVVQTKTTKEKTTKMPAMIFKDTNKEDCFYNSYIKEIEQLIKESIEVDFNNI